MFKIPEIYRHRRITRFLPRLLAIGLFAAAGLALTFSSSAATSVATSEAENGVRANPAQIVPDPAASGDQAVKFTAGTQQSSARFPGDPNPKVTGKAYWGQSCECSDLKVRHENIVGKSVSSHRKFFQWDDHSNVPNGRLYQFVRESHANNRLPFISTKTPLWQEMASGQHNTRIDQLLRELDSYGKPTWLAFHHEPEGGAGSNVVDDPGGPTAWRGMQTKVRERMDAVNTKNIAFMPILMGYTWNPASGRTPNDWWVPGIWDAYMIDFYNDTESGDMIKLPWINFSAWAEARNLPYGTGEWGNRGIDTQAAAEMQAFWDWGFKNKKDVVMYSYFDSSLNSPNGSWELNGEPLNKFRSILGTDSRVKRIND